MTTPRVEIGQKVHGNFGAMYPIVEGMIVDIDIDGLVTWETDEGEEYYQKHTDFKQPGWRSANGSPIGVFLGEWA